MNDLAALDAKLARLLPPRYQHCGPVSPTSMGSAGLKYDADGRVAWGDIWTSFCDLALAGGPPHRGRLLEPVSTQSVAEQPERYREVVEELGRAIRLATAYETVAGHAPGWVGVPCESADEAAWLRAAIVAENVSAGRVDATLQLPAGPAFRVEKEIKNVVVALAKAGHYWSGHLSGDQLSAFRDIVEPDESADATSLGKQLREIAGREVDARYAGWAGVPCDDEEAAAWLLRAVAVEGVLVRREGATLFLPVAADGARVAAAFAAAWRLFGFL